MRCWAAVQQSACSLWRCMGWRSQGRPLMPCCMQSMKNIDSQRLFRSVCLSLSWTRTLSPLSHSLSFVFVTVIDSIDEFFISPIPPPSPIRDWIISGKVSNHLHCVDCTFILICRCWLAQTYCNCDWHWLWTDPYCPYCLDNLWVYGWLGFINDLIFLSSIIGCVCIALRQHCLWGLISTYAYSFFVFFFIVRLKSISS